MRGIAHGLVVGIHGNQIRGVLVIPSFHGRGGSVCDVFAEGDHSGRSQIVLLLHPCLGSQSPRDLAVATYEADFVAGVLLEGDQHPRGSGLDCGQPLLSIVCGESAHGQRMAVEQGLVGQFVPAALGIEGSGDLHVSRAGEIDVLTPAPASSASLKCSGNVFFLFSALRRIPAHALGLKKNLGGTGPVSKTSDNEDTSPALRDGAGVSLCSDPLSVEHAISPPIPQVPQRPEEGTKIPSSVGRQDAGDVFPDNPSRPEMFSDFQVGEHEPSPRVFESPPEAGD